MRIVLTALFFLIFSEVSQAQWLTRPRVQNNQNFDQKPLSFGYYFGVNNLDFNFDYQRDLEDIQVQRAFGFNVGAVANLRISEHIDLRFEPGLVYSNRTLQFPDNPQFDSEEDFEREVASTYIYTPLLLRFSTKRLNNFKPFVTFGIATATNLSSNENNPDDNSAGQFRQKSRSLYYDIGFGVDLYLFWFKFTPSIRGVFSSTDELVPDSDFNSPWTGNITKMSTRGIFLNFTFQ